MIEVENLDDDDSPFSHTREEFRGCKKRERIGSEREREREKVQERDPSMNE